MNEEHNQPHNRTGTERSGAESTEQKPPHPESDLRKKKGISPEEQARRATLASSTAQNQAQTTQAQKTQSQPARKQQKEQQVAHEEARPSSTGQVEQQEKPQDKKVAKHQKKQAKREAREAKRQEKIQRKKEQIERHMARPAWQKVLFFFGRWMAKILFVLLCLFFSVIIGLMVGMAVGEGRALDALDPHVWRHLYEFIFPA